MDHTCLPRGDGAVVPGVDSSDDLPHHHLKPPKSRRGPGAQLESNARGFIESESRATAAPLVLAHQCAESFFDPINILWRCARESEGLDTSRRFSLIRSAPYSAFEIARGLQTLFGEGGTIKLLVLLKQKRPFRTF